MAVKKTIAAALSALTLASGPAAAGEGISHVSLLPGWQLENGNRMIGVRVELAPGWKTYWRAPDGTGIPPQFDWSGSANLSRAEVNWPRPKIMQSFGTRIIGYENEVIYPVEITPDARGGEIDVSLSMFYGVCEEVCVPARADVEMRVGPGEEAARGAIGSALQSGPRSPREAGITAVRCTVRPAGDGFRLTASLDFSGRAPAPEAAVFEPGSDSLWITPVELRAEGNRLTIEAEMEYLGEGALALDRGKLRLSLFGPGPVTEITGCPAS